MFSLQRLMGKEDKFFDLLEASAQESRSSVQALIRFMKNPDELKTLDEFVMSRRKEKKINDEISEALCTTFVTARYAALRRTAYALTGSHHDAEDLVQTALMKAAGVWARIEERPEPHVRRIMYHENVSRWRRRRVREEPLVDGRAV